MPISNPDNISDLWSERAVLACLMLAPEKMIDCSIRLRQEDFANPNNQYLYSLMSFIFSRGGEYKFDISTLMSMARNQGKEIQFLERSGGESYLEFLESIKTTSIDTSIFNNYVDQVKECSNKRQIFNRLSDVQEKIVNEPLLKSEELIIHGQEHLNRLLFTAVVNKHYDNLGDKSGSLLESVVNLKRDIIGIRTLFPDLDKNIEGLKRKNLLIISAPRKTGKSAFLMNIGLNTAILQKIPTLMISTEMSNDEIIFRSISNLSMVQEIDIRKGKLNSDSEKKVFEAQEKFRQGLFFHTYMIGFTVEKIIGCVRKFINDIVGKNEKNETKDCLVIFDYIKMPQSGITFNAEQKEYKVLGAIADSLKMLAGELDIPILSACQTNRAGETANSFELEWFCNTLMLLKNKNEKQMQNEAADGISRGNQILEVKANRGGAEGGIINFEYQKPILKYIEL